MELHQISDVQRDEIYKVYDVNKERIDEDVKLLEEWIQKQAHLPKKLQYNFFPIRMLIANKFSVERAKERIEKYFTLKTLYKNFYTVFGTEDFIKPSKNQVLVVPLPKLGPLNERIMFIKIKTPNAELHTSKDLLQWGIAALEMMNMYDQTASLRVIGDMENYTFDHLKKIDINGCLKFGNLLTKGYGVPMLSIDYINVHPSIHFVLSLTKQMLTGKLLQRLKVHSDLKSLYESLPQDYLPEEYGGTACKLSDVTEKMEVEIENHRWIIADSANYASDESLRIDGRGMENTGENFGLDGTFKKLNLD